MSYTDALLESDLSYAIFENENDIRGAMILEAGVRAVEQCDVNLVNYVMENYDSFLGRNYKETQKNILAFTQAAKNQFLAEVSARMAAEISEYILPQDRTPRVTAEDYI